MPAGAAAALTWPGTGAGDPKNVTGCPRARYAAFTAWIKLVFPDGSVLICGGHNPGW
jgi:hypothetical protein